jgi:hypothetical protein
MMKYITRRATAVGAVAGLLAIGFLGCSRQPAEQSGSTAKIETQSLGVKPFTTEQLNRRTIDGPSTRRFGACPSSILT